MHRTHLKVLLVKHEGDKRHPYKDTTGHTTIGVGRNLDAKPLSDEVVAMMLEEDILEAWHRCQRIFQGFDGLDEARQHALLDMAFNLGEELCKFTKFIAAVEHRDWDAAAKEALDSRWSVQVGRGPGQRADTIARMLRTGVA